MRILIAEDEKDLRLSLAEGLRLAGYAVDTCDNGDDAAEMAYCEDYDLILLDINLPGMDGFSVLQEIRRENQTVNILILTARSDAEDKIWGLDQGANDYLTKPFHFGELLARIRSLLRRKVLQQDTLLCCRDIQFDTASRRTLAKGSILDLTGKETAILEYMLMNLGQLITLGDLMVHVWDDSIDSFSNAARVHISSLRRKLKASLSYDPIRNRIGEGYILEEEEQ